MSVTFVPSKPIIRCAACWVEPKERKRYRPTIEFGIRDGKIVLWKCPRCGWTYEPTHQSKYTGKSGAEDKVESEEAKPVEEGKNPAAVALGRLGGLKGGKARAKSLTKEQRSHIAQKAALARWGKKKPGDALLKDFLKLRLTRLEAKATEIREDLRILDKLEREYNITLTR